MDNRHHALMQASSLVALITLEIVLSCAPAFCQAPTSFNQVELKNNWLQRRNRHSSCRWTATGTTTIPELSRTNLLNQKAFPDSEYEFRQMIELQLDLNNQMIRRKTDRQIYNLSNECYEYEIFYDLYNGKEFQEFVPKDELQRRGLPIDNNLIDLKLKGHRSTSFVLRCEEFPILFHHGLTLPELIDQTSLTQPSLVYDFSIIDETEQSVTIRYDFSSTKKHALYTLDKLKDYSIICYREYYSDLLYFEMETNFESKGEFWVPSNWSITKYAPNDTGSLTKDEFNKFVVQDVEFNKEYDVSMFQVKASPGMIVYDAQKDIRYIEPALGEKP